MEFYTRMGISGLSPNFTQKQRMMFLLGKKLEITSKITLFIFYQLL